MKMGDCRSKLVRMRRSRAKFEMRRLDEDDEILIKVWV